MKNLILACNYPLLIQCLLNNNIPKTYLNEDYDLIFSEYIKKFNCKKFLFDRSGNTPHYLNVENNCQIPDATGFNMSFNEVAEKRAKELLNLGKPINVSWSGGIDSTFVLFTLYNYANDKSQIKVYGTYNSIIESGDLFDKNIKNTFKFNINTNTSYDKNYTNDKDEIYVTGSMGNNIFYQDLSYNLPDTWMQFKNPVENAIEKYADSCYENVITEDTVSFLYKSIKSSQRKIETLQDLRWWIQFAFNWHIVKYNTSIELSKDKVSKIHGFFGSEDFQKWSINNKDVPTKKGDFSDERWQMREMIDFYTGNTNYSKYKKNAVSTISPYTPDWLFLLNDYSNIYLQDL